MPVVNHVASFADDLKTWRRHLHACPELGLECHETAHFVVQRLREFGVDEIHETIAVSGVVAIIEGRGTGPTIGLRADMDALPILEETGVYYASRTSGRMHACGHDGHTTMLLGAARYLAETRKFSGRVALIFQPGEEMGDGGTVMCEQGILEEFEIARIFALHTSASFGVGQFGTRKGPIMASTDEFEIRITGEGGHGAFPHLTTDPVATVLQLGQALQTILARNVPALEHVVVSVTQIHAGTASNVIPEEATLRGIVRSYSVAARALVRTRFKEICEGMATVMRTEINLDYNEALPPTVNHPDQAEFAADVAAEIVGAENVLRH
jgi:hippurate hydrolase